MSDPKVTLLDGPFDPGRHTLIFVHIPKCGGTSMHRTLGEVLAGRYRHLKGRPEDREGLEQFSGIGGHMGFGVTPLHKTRDNIVYMTILREPGARVLSFYKHVQDHSHHHLRAQYPALHLLNPVEFVKKLAEVDNYEIRNLQSRLVLGREPQSADDVIAHAEAHYSVVGLLEEDASIFGPLGRLFPNMAIPQNRLNVSRAAGLDFIDDPAYRAVVADTNAIDQALYQHFAARHHGAGPIGGEAAHAPGSAR